MSDMCGLWVSGNIALPQLSHKAVIRESVQFTSMSGMGMDKSGE